MPPTNPRDIVGILLAHPRRWIVPAIVAALIACTYSVIKQGPWQATQALAVRNQVNSRGDEMLGQFVAPEELKSAQSTIIELASSPKVMRAALVEVGPEDGETPAENWPTDQDIERMRDSVKISAPAGAEFGTSEIFYLNVKHTDRERAIDLTSAISKHLQVHFQRLHTQRAEGLTLELENAVKLARGQRDDASTALAAFEANVGTDLNELRTLLSSPSNTGSLNQRANEMERTLRGARLELQNRLELRSLLQNPLKDEKAIGIPNELLQSQPAILRLKNGLADAQIATARLRGSMTDSHPSVTAAAESEQRLRSRLDLEINTAIRDIDTDIRLLRARVQLLNSRFEGIRERLKTLAGHRAAYGNLVTDVELRTENLKSLEQSLSVARAMEAGTESSTLISRLDEPYTGPSRSGLGIFATTLAGFSGGLIIGLALLFVTVDLQPKPLTEEKKEFAKATVPSVAPLNDPWPPRDTPQSFGRDPEPESRLEPAWEPRPDSVPGFAHDVTQEPAQDPIPKPETTPEPAALSMPESAPETAQGPSLDPLPEPEAASTPEPTPRPESSYEPAPERSFETPEPSFETAPEPLPEPTPEPAVAEQPPPAPQQPAEPEKKSEQAPASQPAVVDVEPWSAPSTQPGPSEDLSLTQALHRLSD